MNQPKQENNIICVLGMHRSGTSMTMRLLNLCGVYVGEANELLIGEISANEKGYWENEAVIKINEKILSLFNGSWHNPPTFPEEWVNDERLSEIKNEAKDFVEIMNVKSNTWGFKDPRTCLTLPFWQSLIPNITYIIPTRNPIEVTNSLLKRDQKNMPINAQKMLFLWGRYWMDILKNTKDQKRFFVLYKDLLSNWKVELGKVLNFINLKDLSFDDKEKEIEDFIDPSLRHQKVEKESDLSPEINHNNEILFESFSNELFYISEEIYKRSQDEIESNLKIIQKQTHEISEAQKIIDEKNKQLEDSKEELVDAKEVITIKEADIENKNKVIQEKEGLIQKKDQLIQGKESLIEDKNKLIQEKENLIQSRDQLIQEKKILIQEKDSLIQRQENELESKEKNIHQSNKTIEEKEAILLIRENRIKEMESSKFWKAQQLYLKIYLFFKKLFSKK